MSFFKKVISRVSKRFSLGNSSHHGPSDGAIAILLDHSPDCVVIHRDQKVLMVNRQTVNFFGSQSFSPADGISILDFVPAPFRPLVAQRQKTILTTGQPSPLAEITFQMRDGSLRQVSITTSLIDFQGQPSFLTFFRDVSEEFRICQELLDSRERLHLALDAAQDGVWDWDLKTGNMIYNETWAQMLGYRLNELEDQPSVWQFLIHPRDHSRAMALLQAHFRGEVPKYEIEVRLRHKSGHYIWVLDQGKVVARDADGQPLRMTGTHRNITARKEAELALETRNRITEGFLLDDGRQKFQIILTTMAETTESGIGLLATVDQDLGLQVTALHPAPDTGTGLSLPVRIAPSELPAFMTEIIDRKNSLIQDEVSWPNQLGLDFENALLVPIANGQRVIGLVMLGNKEQGFFSSDRSLVESLTGYLAPLLDSFLLSEFQEKQLRQAQKMEALGVLAGGIAHDFNNILQAIMGFTTLALDASPPQSTIASDLAKVLKSARRGRNLVQRILLFSRRQEKTQCPVSLCEIARETVELLETSLPPNIELRTRLEEDCGPILGDASQLNQVIMNLATNALHAMEETGGTLEIGTRLIDPHLDSAGVPETLTGRPLVTLWVKDSGIGIDNTAKDHIFDPFFTTNEVGKGTGLGLSVVHGILVNHGGEILVESTPGQGTTMSIFLPLIAPTDRSPVIDSSGSHILFVDNEPDIAVIGRAMLEKLGYRVTTAPDGVSALAEFQTRPDDFDLVITDLGMPQLNGLQLAEKLVGIRADLPVLLITGQDETRFPSMGAFSCIREVIPKPFDLDSLSQAIGRVRNQQVLNKD